MTITEVRDSIISKLNAYMTYIIIEGDTTNEKPGYPYGSYKIITPFVRSFENAKVSYTSTEETYTEDGNITFSFEVHTDNQDVAYNESLKMWNYFRHIGREPLYADGIVIENVETIVDRNVLASVVRERRLGFDVIFRVENVTSRAIVPIETVEVTLN